MACDAHYARFNHWNATSTNAPSTTRSPEDPAPTVPSSGRRSDRRGDRRGGPARHPASGDADDAVFERAVSLNGIEAVVELTTLVGYYVTLALQLRVFRVGLPGDSA